MVYNLFAVVHSTQLPKNLISWFRTYLTVCPAHTARKRQSLDLSLSGLPPELMTLIFTSLLRYYFHFFSFILSFPASHLTLLQVQELTDSPQQIKCSSENKSIRQGEESLCYSPIEMAGGMETIMPGVGDILGFPSGSVVKKKMPKGKRCRRCGFDPWVEKIPWRRA